MSRPDQLFLLADHIKLTLLERQRARSLGLDSDSQDGHVARSLDQFRDGIASLEQEKARLEGAGDQAAAAALADPIPALRKQLESLVSQFHGFTRISASTGTPPAAAETPPSSDSSTASASSRRPNKTVRFNDPAIPNTTTATTATTSAGELFARYHDDPDASPGYSDSASGMSNDQIHQYHDQILREQDDHLDRLGESIGRQRELSMQIGDELESHVIMLDEVDGVVDRHQTRLDRAKRSLNKVARAAAENKQMTLILVLIVVLVLLIAILK
ncbi:Syntaxin-like protein fsv1 [Escovopsis weberi]|uniref:Syntaxin-like protein fsv1 n=1 Tax=Escovopsis weberi TaxID=150374 RepID=A0A0M8N9H7_ESCWE|nr:Syntaxin-like protein fsv1 [Escovopsis weberi]